MRAEETFKYLRCNIKSFQDAVSHLFQRLTNRQALASLTRPPRSPWEVPQGARIETISPESTVLFRRAQGLTSLVSVGPLGYSVLVLGGSTHVAEDVAAQSATFQYSTFLFPL